MRSALQPATSRGRPTLFSWLCSQIDYVDVDPDSALQRLAYGEVDFAMLTPISMVRSYSRTGVAGSRRIRSVCC